MQHHDTFSESYISNYKSKCVLDLFMGEAEKEVLKKHFPGITILILQAALRLRSYTINLQMLTHHTVFCTIKMYT